MKSACALLNTDGGWLIFGVTPQLKIVGQDVNDGTQQEIARNLGYLIPAVCVQPEYISVPENLSKKVIVMCFDKWELGMHPYMFQGRSYYRAESSTVEMPREIYDERIRLYQPQKFSWEVTPADGITMSDLNEDLIRNCIKESVQAGRLLESALTAPVSSALFHWKLLNNKGELTNGAALLFSKDVSNYPQFTLKMARFVGVSKHAFYDNQEVRGNFFQLLDAGIAFCFKHLSLSGKITNNDMHRVERLEIPYEALREVLINALCHRYWEKYNQVAYIAIYDDRVEISNPGVFPPDITPENIKNSNRSFPHNMCIAHVLYQAKYWEGWGSGVGRIIDACKLQELEEPNWSAASGYITVTFKRPYYDSDIISSYNFPPVHLNKFADSLHKLAKLQQKLNSEVLDNFISYSYLEPLKEFVTKLQEPLDILNNLGLNSQQNQSNYQNQSLSLSKIFLFIEKMNDSYMTAKEMSALFQVKSLDYFRKNYITPALECGLIERLYPASPKHPKQKYKLTKAAKELIKGSSHNSQK